jgi:ABC-type oligopeptide transport system substrate-binding subunit
LRFPAAILAATILAGFAPAASGDQPVRAVHAIAMHGAPKYSDGFSHFSYVNPLAPKGGDLRIAPAGTFDTLNPYALAGVPAAGIAGHVFESLLTRSMDEPFTLYGLLAEKVEMPEDRSWITFHLNPGARFQNGAPVTAEDVIFSWGLLKEKGLANQRGFYRRVEAVDRVGPRAVRMRFAEPVDREMPLIMGLMAVLPRDVYQDLDFERLGMTKPVGSGPYRLSLVDPGRSVTFERDGKYWGRDLAVRRGRDNADTIRYDYYRDGSAAFEAFKTGAVSVRLEPDPALWAEGYGFPAMCEGRVERAEIQHGRPSGMSGIAMNTRRMPFASRAAREAMILAFDFEWANRTLFHGAYQRTRSFFDNSTLAAAGPIGAAEEALLGADLAEIPAEDRRRGYRPPSSAGTARNRANLRRAQALLDDAGLPVRDGVRVDPDSGWPLELELLLNDPRDERLGLVYAESLATLGIALKLRTVDAAQYQRRLLDFDFDMIIHRWPMSLSPGNEQEHFWSSAAADRPGSRNYPGIRSAAIDRAITRITAVRGRPDFETAVRALDRLLLAGRYVVPLFHLAADRLAWQAGWRRPEITPLYGFSLDTLWWDPSPATR